jgi:TusA-related sulfurtransferase
MQPALKTPADLDLRGIRCPLNWARTKVFLEGLSSGARVAVWVDDPRAVQNLPRAAEASGHAVIDVRKRTDGWTIELEC